MTDAETTKTEVGAPSVADDVPATSLDDGDEIPAASPEAPKPAPAHRGGLAGALVGGVVAAGMGFGLAQIVPQGWPLGDTSALKAELATQMADISKLKADITRLADQPTTDTELADRVVALEAAAANAPVLPDLAPLTARIDALETGQAAVATIPAEGDAASSAYLAAQAQALADLQAEVQALKAGGGTASATGTAQAEQAEARLKEVEARAVAMKVETEAVLKNTLAMGALGQLRAALDSGAPFAALLPDLGPDIPETLTAQAQAGIPTLQSLRESFSAAARIALEAAIHADMGQTWTERISSFLKSETGARSLIPREGNDPDAVLSRAEAALMAGDLAQALTEMEGLPQAAKSVMTDWRNRAEARQAAVMAISELSVRIGGQP